MPKAANDPLGSIFDCFHINVYVTVTICVFIYLFIHSFIHLFLNLFTQGIYHYIFGVNHVSRESKITAMLWVEKCGTYNIISYDKGFVVLD